MTLTKVKPKPRNHIIYMEVYSANRMIYRVTADSICQGNLEIPVYGVMVENIRTGEEQHITDFSNSLEETVQFANLLIQKQLRPAALYDVALAHLSQKLL